MVARQADTEGSSPRRAREVLVTDKRKYTRRRLAERRVQFVDPQTVNKSEDANV